MKHKAAIGIDTSFKPFAPTCTDGYKIAHAAMYPEGVDFTYGNGTFRSDRLFIGSKSQSKHYDNKVLWVGIQAVLMEVHGLWQRSFFDADKDKAIKRYSRRMTGYLGDPAANVKYLEALWDLGHLPVTVLALPEGSRVNMNVPPYVIYSFGEHTWIMNYLETIISSMLWKICCNATIAYEYRRVFADYALKTAAPQEFIPLQGHDFSFRGMSGYQDAAFSGFGHLTVFAGTDTLPAIDLAEDMYQADSITEFVACSVPATEHAVATANILSNYKKIVLNNPDVTERNALGLSEKQFIKRMITDVHKTGIVSLVSDSFYFWDVITTTAVALKEEILARQPDVLGNAKVVFRPDSGDPVDVLCGLEVFTSEELVDNFNKAHELTAIEGQGVATNGKRDTTKEDFGLKALATKPMVLVTHGSAFFRAYNRNALGDVKPDGVVGTLPGWWLVPVVNNPLTAEEKGAVQALWEIFGGTHTPLGYKVLHERVGLIYGDSITVERAEEILRRLMKKGFASNNVVFGIGSYTYQHNTRDTFGFAIKATACSINGDLVELFKRPSTEKDTLKKSAKGLLKVIKEGDDFVLLQEQEMEIGKIDEDSGELKPIYKNGVFVNQTTLSEIRDRVLQA